jgi:pilus assembly protein CpaB
VNVEGLARFAGSHRGALAASVAALAVLATVTELRQVPPAGVAVLVAATQLPAGSVLTPADLRSERLPAPDVPEGVLRPGSGAVGRLLGTELTAGEPLTAAALAAPAGLGSRFVEALVQLSDPTATAALLPGERVEVFAASPDGSAAAVLASDALIVALPAAGETSGLVMIEVSPGQALRLAAAAAADRISVAVQSPA